MFEGYLERQQRFRSLRALPRGPLALAGASIAVAAPVLLGLFALHDIGAGFAVFVMAPTQVLIHVCDGRKLGAGFAVFVMAPTLIVAGGCLILADLVLLLVGPPRPVDAAYPADPLPAARARIGNRDGRLPPPARRCDGRPEA